jgi:hypothetical protein
MLDHTLKNIAINKFIWENSFFINTRYAFMRASALPRTLLLLTLISGISHSASASVVYQSTSFATATTNGTTFSDNQGPTSVSASYADAHTGASYAGANAYGNAGNYGVSAAGGANDGILGKTFSAFATSTSTWTLTNDTGVASAFTSSWLVNQVDLYTRLGVGSDWGRAMFGFTLSDSGTVLASAMISLDGTGNIVTSGMSPSRQTYIHYPIEETHWVIWDAFTFNINLGILLPGDSKTLIYTMFASADGDYSNTPSGYCPTTDSDCPAPRVGASGSDPGVFSGLPVATFSTPSISQVPEPSSLLLLGLALPMLAQRKLIKQRH